MMVALKSEATEPQVFVEGGGLQLSIKERLIREAFVAGMTKGNGYHEDLWCTAPNWLETANEEFDAWMQSGELTPVAEGSK